MGDNQLRNVEIVRLHVQQGWTYQAIGDRFGLTRERVRQLLRQAGAVDHDRTQALRLEQLATAARLAQAEFDRQQGPSIRALLIEDIAPGEIAQRLTMLGRPVTEKEVREFAARHHLPTPNAPPVFFADPVLRIAVLAAAAATAGLRPEPVDAPRLGSVELNMLIKACASIAEVEQAAGLACCAQRNRDRLTITIKAYDRWRDAWLVRFPKRHLYPWPVTAQTIVKRLGRGFWNDAVRDVGLALNVRGRTRGRVVYTEDDAYEQTMALFVADAVDAGMRPSGQEYKRWAASRPVPSQHAVFLHFGNWKRALQVGLARSGRTLPRRGVAIMPEADRLVDLHLEQLQRLLEEAVDRLSEAMPKPEWNRRYKETVTDLAGDLVSEFESFRRRWLLAAAREEPQGFLANLNPNGRASNKERRVWGSVRQRPIRDVIDTVVDERRLDALLSATDGDLCDDGGWLAPTQRARLQHIDPQESKRWRVLKAARNSLEHRAERALTALAIALTGLDSESDGPLMVRVPPNSAANVVIWLAAEVGAPDGHSSASRLQRSRLAHLHAMLERVTQAMRSVPSRSGNVSILHRPPE